MNQFFLLFCFVLIQCIAFGKQGNTNLLWVNPTCGDWETIDSLELGKLEKGGTRAPSYYQIACYDSLNWASFVEDGSFNPYYCVFRTTQDGGKNWKVTYSDSHDSSAIKRIMSFIVYPKKDLIICTSDSGYILKSTDGGYNWITKRLPAETYDNKFNQIEMHGNIGIVRGSNNLFYITEDWGDSWNKIGLTTPKHIDWLMNFSMPDTNTLFIAGYADSSLLYFSSLDRGKTWKYLSKKAYYSKEGISNFKFIDGNIGWGSVAIQTWEYSNNNYFYFYKTTDGGKNWLLQYSDPDSMAYGVSKPIFSDSLNGLIYGVHHVYLTNDGGLNWKKYFIYFDNKFLVYPIQSAFFPTKGNPMFTLGPKIIRYNGNETDIKEINNVEVDLQIYPNPVESAITINFPLKYQSSQIKIFSIEGIEVFKSSDEWNSSDDCRIDVSSFAPGVYYVRLGDRVCRFIKM